MVVCWQTKWGKGQDRDPGPKAMIAFVQLYYTRVNVCVPVR
jgi:hypothetical protein